MGLQNIRFTYESGQQTIIFALPSPSGLETHYRLFVSLLPLTLLIRRQRVNQVSNCSAKSKRFRID